jgi:hypothetical protein
MRLTGAMLAAMKTALNAEIYRRQDRREATLHYEEAIQWVNSEFARREKRMLRG